jgi:hypothetical protein
LSRYGAVDEAGLRAAMKADKALAKGNLISYRFWRHVIDALADMGAYRASRG